MVEILAPYIEFAIGRNSHIQDELLACRRSTKTQADMSYSPQQTIGTGQRLGQQGDLLVIRKDRLKALPEDPSDAPWLQKAPNPGEMDHNLNDSEQATADAIKAAYCGARLI
ncbi:hypothetical protein INS49_006988 [Diaporthe citri]|uniref:uncharacterized protein n=1 Tax=Diaporthe citri TaxID=83186 RepID=UPI001C7F7271|nr:uncharacterized protein INS49_006988 [Diaporthe citri]KAG6365377.1 hypothetical protein INS49_006988 [Diaporthe citri]